MKSDNLTYIIVHPLSPSSSWQRWKICENKRRTSSV